MEEAVTAGEEESAAVSGREAAGASVELPEGLNTIGAREMEVEEGSRRLA